MKNNSAKIWSLNHRLLTVVITQAADEITELGLEVKEFFVLAEVDDCPHPAGLAKRLAMPKPSVTVYLKSLEAAGFVRREIDPADLRRHRLIVTPAGRKKMLRASEIFSAEFDALLARLSGKEREEFQRLLEKMTND